MPDNEIHPNSPDAWFARLDGKLEMHGKTLERIEEQARKTNGRVTCLEGWRNRIVGAIGILTFLAGWWATYHSGK